MLKNLAGAPDADVEVLRELTRAQIICVRGQRSTGEVATCYTGKLGQFEFFRAWRYWVVKGEVPLAVARQLHADSVGADIRAGGHCEGLPPERQLSHFDADGKRLQLDPDGKLQESFDQFFAKGQIRPEDHANLRFVKDIASVSVRAVVDVYHIDSEVGLRVFVDTVRNFGLTRT